MPFPSLKYMEGFYKSVSAREVIGTENHETIPLAELIDLYSENKRAALEHEGKARMYLAEILYALAGNADRPETVLHVIQRLRML